MINIWIAFLMIISTMITFKTTADIGYINRIFTGINFAVLYNAIEWGTVTDGTDFAFSRTLAKEYIVEYYEEKLMGRVSSFSLYFAFDDAEGICSTSHCSSVSVRLKANIYAFVEFDRILQFSVVKGVNY